MKLEELHNIVADHIQDDGYFPTPSIVAGCSRVCAAVAVQFQQSAKVSSDKSTGLPAFMFLSTAAAVRAVYHGSDAKNPPFLTPRIIDILKSSLLNVFNVQLTPMEAEDKILFLNMNRINDGVHIGRTAMMRYAAFDHLPAPQLVTHQNEVAKCLS